MAVLVASSMLLGACGGSGEAGEAATTEASQETAADSAATEAAATTTEAATTRSGTAAACEPGEMPLEQEGVLTVATGEPVFEPWMVDDDPSNQQGFESALTYAVAEELGFAPEDVTWVRTGFDEAIAPGDKPYDFNVQQYSINDQRDEVVDFSTGYYEVEQALVAAEDSEVAEAETVSDLQSARLGAAIGTTSLDYVEQVIQPETPAVVFDDNAAAKAAFDAGQVDGLVFDLPTAYYVTAVEIPDASIVGVLPLAEGESEELGFLFEEGSELVPCVNEALAALREDGTLEELENEWLNQSGDIPTLER